ncbi:MAG: hypothetical protein O3C43_21045 [Verrucomicrobia bacterium]|nr:hypothetical protein [Verrucomicrobiota bacterium]MDA1068980.1 hypothetical protein [Verrucomicrobiota bacterium]
MIRISMILATLFGFAFPLISKPLVYEGGEGIGKGKHIVFIANDHEYRSEETCPALAKILAKHHGFKCTVIFGLDENGAIKGGGRDMPGVEALKDADLLFLYARFMDLPDEQVNPLVEYFERGGPVVGVRTSTHCFNGQDGKWEKLNFNYTGEDYFGGLGEQIFGNTWHKERGQSHYGSNHEMGCRITPDASAKGHPILKGVKSIHAYSGAYKSQPPADATPLLEVQVLNTFHASNSINTEKPIVNAGWSRDSYVAPSGTKKKARVVYASYGASEDLLSEDGRRFLVNACLWAGGWEKRIKPNLNVDIVGGFQPSAYNNGVGINGVKPQDLAGWDSQVMPIGADIGGLSDPTTVAKLGRVIKNRPELRARIAAEHPEFFVSGGPLEGN